MKRLYIVRHAKSSWNHPELLDIDRPLNKRGKRDAPVMGDRLCALGVKPDIIVSSPAKRARQTAKKIAYHLGYPKKRIAIEELLYDGYTNNFIRFIRGIDDVYDEVILVGHNPDFTELANRLANQRIGHVPTCGVVGIEFLITSWHEVKECEGTFLFFDFPKKSTR